MPQALHLLIVDVERGEALATWHGPRWLLPIVVARERARVGLSIPTWMSDHCQIDGRFIGQWLGRADLSSHTIDWLGIVRARFGDLRAVNQHLRPTSLAALTQCPALVPYQQWAIERTLSVTAIPSTLGPFGTMTWPAEVDAWLETVVGDLADGCPDVVVHRAAAYDVVLEYRTPRRRWFFKGLPASRGAEPVLTARLAELAPRSFPTTIAVSVRPNQSVWWLIEACPGAPLAAGLTNTAAVHVATQYARVQQTAAQAIASGRISGLPSLDLSRLVAWAALLLRDATDTGLAARTVGVLGDSCRRAGASDVPRSWMSADFDPTNVLVDNGDVRFIDLGDCAFGPAPTAAAIFVRRLMRQGLVGSINAWDAYARAWRPPLDLRDRWRAFQIASSLVECHLDWQRVMTKTDRGEVEGLLEPARQTLASRLIAAAGETTHARVN